VQLADGSVSSTNMKFNADKTGNIETSAMRWFFDPDHVLHLSTDSERILLRSLKIDNGGIDSAFAKFTALQNDSVYSCESVQ